MSEPLPTLPALAGSSLPTCSPSSGLDSDSIVASCDCLTKTPEVKYHKPGCKYRLISERDTARQIVEYLRDLIPVKGKPLPWENETSPSVDATE